MLFCDAVYIKEMFMFNQNAIVFCVRQMGKKCVSSWQKKASKVSQKCELLAIDQLPKKQGKPACSFFLFVPASFELYFCVPGPYPVNM